MAEKIKFDLVAPERAIASVEADLVEAPGVDGEIGVLSQHAPFMTVLSPGVVRYVVDGKETRIFVRGGFAEVTPGGLTILAEEAVPVAELNREDIKQRIKDAEEDLTDTDVQPETRLHAERELAQLRDLEAAL